MLTIFTVSTLSRIEGGESIRKPGRLPRQHIRRTLNPMNACLWFALFTVRCPVSRSAAADAGSAGKPATAPEAATPADKPRPQFQYKSEGKANQRATGRWWMKSLYRDTVHYLTYLCTTQALRALARCGELGK